MDTVHLARRSSSPRVVGIVKTESDRQREKREKDIDTDIRDRQEEQTPVPMVKVTWQDYQPGKMLLQTMFAVMDDMHRIGIARPTTKITRDEYTLKAQHNYIRRQDQQRYAQLEKAFDTKPQNEDLTMPPEPKTMIQDHVSYVNPLPFSGTNCLPACSRHNRIPQEQEALTTYSFLRQWSRNLF